MAGRTGAYLIMALVAGGCIVPADPCGKNQVEYDELFVGCVCAEGAVPDEDGKGCVFCGDGEVAQGQACVCMSGFERNGEGECAEASDGGSAAPSGQDMPCSSEADCAGTDATFCESLQGNVCLVQGCAVGDTSCAAGRECCDLSAIPLGGLDTAGGLCVPEGTCMAPGVVVQP